MLNTRLRHAADIIVEAVCTGSRRRNHLRLVRRNGQPVPVPLRAAIKTRNFRMGRLAAAVLLVLSLMAAGIGGSIYLGLHVPAVSLSAAE